MHAQEIVDFLAKTAKEDNPPKAVADLMTNENLPKGLDYDDMGILYDIVYKIFTKGKRIGYINGRKALLEEINDRYKEV